MRNGIFPIFTKGRVLKKESVEYLRDFPNDLASLAFGDYSDGVLFGFSVNSRGDGVHISKGALKYNGNIIVVPESTVTTADYGQLLYIKLAIDKFTETDDYITCPIGLVVDGYKPSSENEIELGRFCLERGAELRCEYDSFGDLRTVENTLDITNVCYAGIKAATLHPQVMKEYARALIAGSSDAADVSFALMCLNAGVVHKSVIQWHIARKTGGAYAEYALNELYEKLAETLPQHGRTHKPEKPRGRGPIIS